MRSPFQTRFQWVVPACALAGAGVFVAAAVCLVVEAATGHGGDAGNILRLGFGVLALFIGLFFLVIAALSWTSSSERHVNESR